jgi:hypothetical protein
MRYNNKVVDRSITYTECLEHDKGSTMLDHLYFYHLTHLLNSMMSEKKPLIES